MEHVRALVAVIVVVLVLAAPTGFIHFRDDLTALDVAVDTQWKQVENQLARQQELIPQLVTIAKQYAEHETGILESPSEARTRHADAKDDEKPLVARDFDGPVETLALGERYPDLQANEACLQLSFEIAGTQHQIAVESKRYNDLVGLLNARVRQVPPDGSSPARALARTPSIDVASSPAARSPRARCSTSAGTSTDPRTTTSPR